MKDKLPKPPKDAIIYEDNKLYACLASHPKTRGHSIVAWKNNVPDLRFLSDSDYDYLMDKVDQIRDALIKALKIKKVYLIYMDETKHVHWHLIPRYNEQGYDVLTHKPKKLKNFSLAKNIRNNLRIDKQ